MFEAKNGDFAFTDDGGIYSDQVALKDPEGQPTNALDTKVWAATAAAFSLVEVSMSFELQEQDLLLDFLVAMTYLL